MDGIYQFVTGGNLTLFLAVIFTFLSAFGLLYPFLTASRRVKITSASFPSNASHCSNAHVRKIKSKLKTSKPHRRKIQALTLFKLEKLTGAKAARALLIQAGYRHPKSLLVYLLSRLILLTGASVAGVFFRAEYR